MDEPRDLPPLDLSQVDSINNLDTARMSLRWALERIHSLESQAVELAARVELEAKVREKAQKDYEGLRKTLENLPQTEPERRRFSSTLEEYVLLTLAGKLDMAPLAARELQAAKLKESAEAARARYEQEYQARRASLEEEFERLRDEHREMLSARQQELKEQSLSLHASLEEEGALREAEARKAEEDLKRRETELAVRSARLEDSAAANRGRAEEEFELRRNELERDNRAWRMETEQAMARKLEDVKKAWEEDRRSLLLQSEDLKRDSGSHREEIDRLRENLALFDRTTQGAEQAFARESEQLKILEEMVRAKEAEWLAREIEWHQTLGDKDYEIKNLKSAAELGHTLEALKTLEGSGAAAELEKERDSAREEARLAREELRQREEELALQEKNLREQVEWVEQSLTEARQAPAPLAPAAPAPSAGASDELRLRLAALEEAARKSQELLDRERVWRQDMAQTWDFLRANVTTSWQAGRQAEALELEITRMKGNFSDQKRELEKRLALAEAALREELDGKTLALARVREKLEAEKASAEENFTLQKSELEKRLAQLEAWLRSEQADKTSAFSRLKEIAEEKIVSERTLALRIGELEKRLALAAAAAHEVSEIQKIASARDLALLKSELEKRLALAETERREAQESSLAESQARKELEARLEESQKHAVHAAELQQSLSTTEQASLETAKSLQQETQRRELLIAELTKARRALEEVAQRMKRTLLQSSTEIEGLKSSLTAALEAQRAAVQSSQAETLSRQELEKRLADTAMRKKELEDFIASKLKAQ